MKLTALSLAVMALLCPTFASAWGNPFNNDNSHSNQCKRVRTAADKLHFIVRNSWGAGKANDLILRGVDVQAANDIITGSNWNQKLATITVDPQTGDPLDCGAIRDKHSDFLKAYDEIRPKFIAAADACVTENDAISGRCAKAVDEAFKARNAFITTKIAPFVTAERAAPPYCQAAFNGYLNGVSLLSDGRLPEPCARPYYPGARAICSGIPLKGMKDAANEACKDNLAKMQKEDDPLLAGAYALCPAINKVRDNLESLRANFNKPNKVFFEASIGAVIARTALLNLKKSACDPPPYVAPPYDPNAQNDPNSDNDPNSPRYQ